MTLDPERLSPSMRTFVAELCRLLGLEQSVEEDPECGALSIWFGFMYQRSLRLEFADDDLSYSWHYVYIENEDQPDETYTMEDGWEVYLGRIPPDLAACIREIRTKGLGRSRYDEEGAR